MKNYVITGKGDGHEYGTYHGEDEYEALVSLFRDAGCDAMPILDDWHVEERTGRTMLCPKCGRAFLVVFGDPETCLWDDHCLIEEEVDNGS